MSVNAPEPISVGLADKNPLIQAALRQLLSEDERFRLVHVVYGDHVIETATFRATPPDVSTADGDLLIVEDNAVNQRIAVALLERQGYRTSVTANGQEALERLRVATGGDDRSAGLGISPGYGETDTLIASGNNCDFSV